MTGFTVSLLVFGCQTVCDFSYFVRTINVVLNLVIVKDRTRKMTTNSNTYYHFMQNRMGCAKF